MDIAKCEMCGKAKKYTTFVKGRPNVKIYRIECDCNKQMNGFDEQEVIDCWNRFAAPIRSKNPRFDEYGELIIDKNGFEPI